VWCRRVMVCVEQGARLLAGEGCGLRDTKASLPWHPGAQQGGQLPIGGWGVTCAWHALLARDRGGRVAGCMASDSSV
jgi:hypothetical protein